MESQRTSLLGKTVMSLTGNEVLDTKQFFIHFLDYSPNGQNDIGCLITGLYLANVKVAKEQASMISTIKIIKKSDALHVPDMTEIIEMLLNDKVIEAAKDENSNLSIFKLIKNERYKTFHINILNCIRDISFLIGHDSCDVLSIIEKQKSWKKAQEGSVIDVSDDMFTDKELKDAKERLKDIPKFK